MSYRSDGGGPAASASGHGAVPRLQRRPRRCDVGGARAVSGQWPPRGTPGETAGERRRGRRIGADVPTLTNPDFVLTSGAQVAPTVEPWPAGLAAPAGLVPRPPSERWRSWSYEAGPAAAGASAWSVLPYIRLPAATPQPSPTRPSRQRPVNRPPRQPVEGGQSIKRSSPPFAAGPASKVREKLKR